jgi:glyoxylase-like metal-dependent hydrolase (beta-lactamase superfamily II)
VSHFLSLNFRYSLRTWLSISNIIDTAAFTFRALTGEDRNRSKFDFTARYRDAKTIEVVPAEAKGMDARVHALRFDSKPYETFDESADIFGDGSVVVVKLPGHTPGSIGTFVNLSPTFRNFHVGDAVNANETIERPLPKSLVMAMTDNNGPQANAAAAKLSQLLALDPGLLMLPAHDRGASQAVFGATPRCIL